MTVEGVAYPFLLALYWLLHARPIGIAGSRPLFLLSSAILHWILTSLARPGQCYLLLPTVRAFAAFTSDVLQRTHLEPDLYQPIAQHRPQHEEYVVTLYYFTITASRTVFACAMLYCLFFLLHKPPRGVMKGSGGRGVLALLDYRV